MWKYLRWICWHSNLDRAQECHHSQKIVYVVVLLFAAAISLQKRPSGVHSWWFSSSFWEHLAPVARTLKLNVDITTNVTVTPIQQVAPDLVVTILRWGKGPSYPQHGHMVLACAAFIIINWKCIIVSLRIVQRLQKLPGGIPGCSWLFGIKGVGVCVLWGRETKALWIAYEALVYGSIETQLCLNKEKQNIKAFHLVDADVLLWIIFFKFKILDIKIGGKAVIAFKPCLQWRSVCSYLSGAAHCRSKEYKLQ